MDGPENTSKVVLTVRWFARLISIMLVALVIMLAFGEGFPSPFTLTSLEFVLFAALIIMLAGFLVAWRNEGLGGLLILLGFLIFFVTNYAGTNSLRLGIFFILFPVTGAMFVFCWLGCRRKPGGLKH